MPQRMIKPRIMKTSSRNNRPRVDSRVMIRAVRVKHVMLKVVMIAFFFFKKKKEKNEF